MPFSIVSSHLVGFSKNGIRGGIQTNSLKLGGMPKRGDEKRLKGKILLCENKVLKSFIENT